MVLLRLGEPAEHRADLPFGPRFERLEGLAAARGDRQEALPGVVRRDVLADQPALVKAAQDAAEIAGVEAEIAADVGRGGAVALLDLVEHARFGQRERAVEPAVLQHAEMLGVEAVEAAHRGDALRIVRSRSCHDGRLGQLLDGVKYHGRMGSAFRKALVMRTPRLSDRRRLNSNSVRSSLMPQFAARSTGSGRRTTWAGR